MHLMDKYILKGFFQKLFSTTLAFIVIFIVVDIIDHLDKFIDSSMPAVAILKYYIYTIPWFISIGFPMAILLSTVFTLSLLQKHSELTALKASGIGVNRVAIPLLLMGFLFSFISFHFDNEVVTSNYQKRILLEEKYRLRSSSSKNVKKRDIYRQLDSQSVLSIKRFQSSNQTAYGVSIQTFENQDVIKRLDANKMVWNEADQKWNIEKYSQRKWANNQIIFDASKIDTSLSLGITPLDLTRETGKPEEMNYNELKLFVDKIKQNSINEPRWEVNLHFKTALAGTSFLMVLFGIPLAIRKPRSSLAMGIGLSIGVIFLYYAALKFGQTLGYKGVLSPFISVWWANISFFCVGVYLFFKTKS